MEEIAQTARNLLLERSGREVILRTLVTEFTSEDIAKRIYGEGESDPDLIIRTAGEMRMSNFLLWQAAYSEYYSTPVLWPDFDRQELEKALEVFGKRSRKFGKV